MLEADEWTESAGTGVRQPLVEITYTSTRNEPPEPLEQLVAGIQTLIVAVDLVACIPLVVFELVRWTWAQPADVDALHSWPSTPMTTSRFRGRPRTTPELVRCIMSE